MNSTDLVQLSFISRLLSHTLPSGFVHANDKRTVVVMSFPMPRSAYMCNMLHNSYFAKNSVYAYVYIRVIYW